MKRKFLSDKDAGRKGPPMGLLELETLGRELIETSLSSGASLAGISPADDLKHSPSHAMFGVLDTFTGVGTKNVSENARGNVRWPEKARSVLILAVAHPEDEPQLDWWIDGWSGGTRGNRKLMDVADAVASWAGGKGISVAKFPYHIEDGGIFLKDAAVLGGLGCIGKNNLLVTPQFGPRVRLRAVALDADLPATGPIDFDPCDGCAEPCRNACPQRAFAARKYDSEHLNQTRLPGRSGVYDRQICNIQMEFDIANHVSIPSDEKGETRKLVRYCRECEHACPAGR